MTDRAPILYLAPWVGLGGSDKGTIDWFKWLDRDRFRASLITTQPSTNARISEVAPYADEIWHLPDLMSGHQMPGFVLNFIVSRRIRVLHIMNSRLAFELLPDLSALDDPPAVVVQLHVEEEDRSGYTRLVTTRFGNLVDAFSVTSDHLADAVADYGIRRDRIVVIPTGVDAETEFAPDRVPAKDLGRGPHVLYPGRITAQKDPLLMVEVAAKVCASRPDARFEVVGEGELEESMRAAVSRAGLQERVRFHPPTTDLAPWYAASDVLLMTSRFEGVPYVLYEAMAMGLPSVVPRLPGNAELLAEGGGILVAPREEPEPYATAVLSLLNGNGRGRQLGRAARDRVRRDLTVQRMAADHGALYDRLLETRRPSRRLAPPAPPARVRLPRRPATGQPCVTVVMPCYDHARFLPDALASVRAQTYPDIEIIVVDDASGDTETVQLLDELESVPDVKLVRHAENLGPSAARNTGIRLAKGRYVLPVDADNVLLPEAVAALVAQLQAADERVGFIYPNVQYFGNRHDYFVAPHFDLHRLRTANYCDTCALIDRSVFDAGFGFSEDIRLGHEDWDFFLNLAGHGIEGEPAAVPTMRYRKTGFTRSDVVEYRASLFADDLSERHPWLFPSRLGDVDSVAARRQEASLKAVWQPAISVLLLEDVDPTTEDGGRLLGHLTRQTLCDAEIIAPFSEPVSLDGPGPHLRRLAPELPARLTQLFDMARANYVLVVQHSASSLLASPGFFERLVYARQEAGSSVGIAFADGGPDFAGLPFGVLRDVPRDASPIAVASFERYGGPQIPEFSARAGEEVATIVELLEREHVLQWRHAAAQMRDARESREDEEARHDLTPRQRCSERDHDQRAARRYSQPLLPADVRVRRWEDSPWPAWIPPESAVLVRCKQIGGERRVVRFGEAPPPGYEVEHWLGAVQRFGPPGTSRIEAILDADGHQSGFRVVEPDDPAAPRDEAEALGHVEQAGLPLLQELNVARLATGQRTLVAGATDVLLGRCDVEARLGYVEAFPNLPAAPVYERPPARRQPVLLRGLAGRRHTYGVDALGDTRVVATLGQLLRDRAPGSIAVWLQPDGTLATERYVPDPRPPAVAQSARWIGAPLSWRGESPLLPRARATARRLAQATQLSARRVLPASPRATSQDMTIGYLYEQPGPARIELFSALHPVTADQLVTPYAVEATDMGYVDVTSLGFACGSPRSVHVERYALPWASRFGLKARRA